MRLQRVRYDWATFTLPFTILLGLLICHWMWGIFFCWDHSPVNGYSAVSCKSSHTMSTRPSTPPFCETVTSIQVWLNIKNQSTYTIILTGWEKKNHMSISTDAEKTFDKIQHPIMTKSLSKQGLEGHFLNLLKGTYQKKKALQLILYLRVENWMLSP